jgi:hypothetical protein
MNHTAGGGGACNEPWGVAANHEASQVQARAMSTELRFDTVDVSSFTLRLLWTGSWAGPQQICLPCETNY